MLRVEGKVLHLRKANNPCVFFEEKKRILLIVKMFALLICLNSSGDFSLSGSLGRKAGRGNILYQTDCS